MRGEWAKRAMRLRTVQEHEDGDEGLEKELRAAGSARDEEHEEHRDASSTTARQESRLGLISLSCRAARVDSGALRYGIRQYFWL